MTPLELFLVKNLPLTYHVTFTVVRNEKGASIVGGLAACDACDQVVAVVCDLDCDHRELEALALRFNFEQPPLEALEEKIAQSLGTTGAGRKVIFA
ncbi:MAG: hypothetical protein K0S22_42 [Oscillospiraceae bacterium]|jgi:hypothetical protein|nr:hypothetical protein [Oscillospiraceae bacterium]